MKAVDRKYRLAAIEAENQDVLSGVTYKPTAPIARFDEALPLGWRIALFATLADMIRDSGIDNLKSLHLDRSYSSHSLCCRWEDINDENKDICEGIEKGLNQIAVRTCEYCGQPGKLIALEPDPRYACESHAKRLKRARQELMKQAQQRLGWTADSAKTWSRRKTGHTIMNPQQSLIEDHTTRNDHFRKAAEVLRGKFELRQFSYDDLTHMHQSLDTEFPWMKDITKKLLRRMSMRIHLGKSSIDLPNTLLVGPKGTGKSRYVRRIAEHLNIPSIVISVAGSTDSRCMTGTARGWGNAQVSDVIRFVLQHQVANPLICMDEVDKESGNNQNGRITDVLHQFLEPETSTNFYDEYLQEVCDLSTINWIATANDIGHLPDSLLSRFLVLQVPKVKVNSIADLLHQIKSDLANDLQIDARLFPEFEESEISWVEKRLNNGTSLRGIKRIIELILSEKICSPARYITFH